MAKRICTMDGCGRTTAGGPLCKAHYERRRKGQSMELPIRDKRPGGLSPTDAFRYFMPGDPPGDQECWPWQGRSFDKNGYGLIGYDIGYGGNYRANRASHELFNGPIEAGLVVCHTCDNPPCVNPAHLYAGTPLDNSRDRVERGRTVIGFKHRGEDHWYAKLMNAQAEEIREIYSQGDIGTRKLAHRFGVSRSVIRNVVGGKTYQTRA